MSEKTDDRSVGPHSWQEVMAGAELARLLDLNALLTEQLGMFPAPISTLFPLRGEQEYQVLDLACGPGGWVLDVAREVPALTVMGVDRQDAMIRYAQMRAQVQNRHTAYFETEDITQPLPYDDATFQYLQGRFLVGCLRPQDWPALLHECWRIVAPGGFCCLIEAEWASTNSAALECLKRKISRALWKEQRSLSVDGNDLGITPHLGPWLREAGFQHVQHAVTPLEWSAGTLLNLACREQCEVVFQVWRAVVLATGLATPDEYDALYDEMLHEIASPTFCGMIYPLMVWGQKGR